MATATEIETAPPAQMIPADRLFPLSLDVYERMVDSGLLTKHNRVVLLDGLLVKTMPKGPRHFDSTDRTAEALRDVLPDGWRVRQEGPIRLPDGPQGQDSSPEPDVVVARGMRGDYRNRHPNPDEIALIVEVAHSSLADDRKGLARYAWAGIPTVWIINVANDTVEVYTGPSGKADAVAPKYATCEVKRAGDTLPVVLDGEARGAVTVADIVG